MQATEGDGAKSLLRKKEMIIKAQSHECRAILAEIFRWRVESANYESCKGCLSFPFACFLIRSGTRNFSFVLVYVAPCSEPLTWRALWLMFSKVLLVAELSGVLFKAHITCAYWGWEIVCQDRVYWPVL